MYAVTLQRTQAEAAAAEFDRVHAGGEVPTDIPEHSVRLDADNKPLLEVLLEVGLIPSKSEGRRNLGQGGVKVDSERVGDPHHVLGAGTYVLQVGKKRFCRVTLERA